VSPPVTGQTRDAKRDILDSSPEHTGRQTKSQLTQKDLNEMITNTRHSARMLALPIVFAGIVGGAALGLAGTASAEATGGQAPSGPGHSYSPTHKAKPAPSATPGWRNHHGIHHINDLNRQRGR
jgi:hypothetical protein